MESKINYALVGLFVVLLISGLLSFVYWLGKHGGQQDFDYYHVYMAESVAGLSVDASVKYRGVNVGRVEHIGLYEKNPEQVQLLLKIERNTPIKTDATATLKSFGLTGLAYVELEGGSLNAALLSASNDEIPTISASPSLFTQAYESIGSLTTQAAVALDKFNLLLSNENLQNISLILTETKNLTQDIRAQMHGIQHLVDNGIVMEKKITQSFTKIEAASSSVKLMSDALEKNTAVIGKNISQDIHHSLESFNLLLKQLNDLAADMQRTTQAFEDSPSDVIFKSSYPKPGPGEEGYHEQ